MTVKVGAVTAAVAGCAVAFLSGWWMSSRRYATVEQELAQLSRDWEDLRLALSEIKAERFEVDGGIRVGNHVRLQSESEVSNSSLWEPTLSCFCGMEGVVSKLDEDGDAEVFLETGDRVTVDLKFLVNIQSFSVISSRIALFHKRLAEVRSSVPVKSLWCVTLPPSHVPSLKE